MCVYEIKLKKRIDISNRSSILSPKYQLKRNFQNPFYAKPIYMLSTMQLFEPIDRLVNGLQQYGRRLFKHVKA